LNLKELDRKGRKRNIESGKEGHLPPGQFASLSKYTSYKI